MSVRFAPFLVAGLAVLAAGCGEGVMEPRYDADRQSYIIETEVGALLQRIEVSAATPARGDTIRITSTVINRGFPREVELRMCGMDITLLEVPDAARCMAWSSSYVLGTGQSDVAVEERIANLPAGTHEIRLRHLLDPERWVTFRITVQD